jgi:putative ABC transport system ATP-binding protein
MRSAIISSEKLSRKFRVGSVTINALNDVSFEVSKNEFLALMGASGSGKSTLMNLIGCLDTATSGSYNLNGTNVKKMNENDLANVRNKEIGFIFQTFNLLPRYTALENVMLPLIYAGVKKEEREEMAKEVLGNVGLSDRVTHKPNELSGGQRQRVAIARALVNNPSIILADEPTGNLDSKTSVEIMKLFQKIHKKGNTIILVTHEEDIAAYAERIIRLKDGIIESDKKIDNYENIY